MAKRIGVEEKIVILMMALALGKIVGSLISVDLFCGPLVKALFENSLDKSTIERTRQNGS